MTSPWRWLCVGGLLWGVTGCQSPTSGPAADGGTPERDGGSTSVDGGGPALVVGELASRVSGVAPLGVFFDAVGTPGVIQPPEANGHREYANLFYEWDFGDPASGRWADGRARNRATGFVAAHVYETAGAYTARLRVTTPTGEQAHYEVHLTVSSPDTVYAGSATVCLSSGTDFTGCPAGATQLTTTQLSDLSGHVGAGRRVLLRRGDRWVSSTTNIRLTGPGPFTLGAFGPCVSPDVRGLCANAPVIEAPTSDMAVFDLFRLTDARIMDLRMEGALDRQGAIGGATGITAFLALRVNTVGFDTPLGNANWQTTGHDQVMFVDCDASASFTNILFVGSERLAVLGNRFRNPSRSHVLRVWQAYKGVISDNELSGSSLNSDTGRHALKFHGPSEEQVSTTGPLSLAHRSRFTVVSKNLFGSSGPWPVAIGPQDSASDERLEDLVVEQNRFYPGAGEPSCCSSRVQVALSLWARHTTVRNNLFSGDDSANGYTAIAVAHHGGEPAPLGNRLIHNTIFKGPDVTTTNEVAAFSLDAATSDTTVTNNLVAFGSGLTSMLFAGQGTNLVEAGNLMLADPGLVDATNVDWLAKDFSLTPASPAVNAGVPSAAFDDFAGMLRPQGATSDVGAFER